MRQALKALSLGPHSFVDRRQWNTSPVCWRHSPVGAVRSVAYIGSSSCCARAHHFRLSVSVTGLAVMVWKHVDPDMFSCPSELCRRKVRSSDRLRMSAPTCLRWVMPAELLRPQLDGRVSTLGWYAARAEAVLKPLALTPPPSSWTCRLT